MSTIPASFTVDVVPSVLSAGGTALYLQGLILTNNTKIPYGTIQPFPDAASVGSYFGLSSQEYASAQVYFNGFDNSTVKPASTLMTQYPTAAVGAYMRGGPLEGITVGDLQGLSGSLSMVMDGYTHEIASIDLSPYNSFSAMATAIADTFTNPQQATSTASTISGTTLTIGGTLTGSYAVGQVITGTGITAGTQITALGTGTGGAGTYTISVPHTIGTPQAINSEAAPITVTYDSVQNAFVFTSGCVGTVSTAAYATGTLSVSLYLTQVTGAVLSQGAASATPGPFMDGIIDITQNWATFCTLFNPDDSGNTNKLLFAAWANSQDNRYTYIAWDNDVSPTTQVPATSSLGYLIGPNGDNYSGTAPVYDPHGDFLAPFICGAVASIDFQQFNGRSTLAFKGQSGIPASVTSQLIAQNLIANGYNYYGVYATAAQNFLYLYPGLICGPFKWLDSFIDQIWLNNELQLALMSLLTSAKSIPYNDQGYSMIRAACLDPINAGVSFGAIRTGVTLSQQQISQINSAAGKNVAPVVEMQGWYLLIQDASPQVRVSRQSPTIILWFTDGQSIQKIDLSSVLVQ